MCQVYLQGKAVEVGANMEISVKGHTTSVFHSSFLGPVKAQHFANH
jgi:hypothetical protein